MSKQKDAVIKIERFDTTPVLAGKNGIRYIYISQRNADFVVLDDIRKLLGHRDNKYLYNTCKNQVCDPVRIEDLSTGSQVGVIPLYSAIRLLEDYGSDSMSEGIAREMKKWGGRVPRRVPEPLTVLPAVVPTPVKTETASSETLVIGGVTIKQDSEGKYCLNDLHKAAGGEKKHGPSYFMVNQQTNEMIKELLNTGIPVFETSRGRQGGGTYVCKELVYLYAMWVSPKFSLQVIRAYDALVTGQIPGAMPPKQLDLMKRMTLMLEEASEELKAQIEKNTELSTELEEVKPKAEIVDKMVSYTMPEAVSILREAYPELTLQKLSTILWDKGYLTRAKRIPTKSKAAENWFRYGILDAIDQNGFHKTNFAEDIFVTQTGLDGIDSMIGGFSEAEWFRYGMVYYV